jgi:thymidylate synthase ThyX
LVARTSAHDLVEVREFSRRLYEAVAGLAPSVIKYTEATAFERETAERLRRLAGKTAATGRAGGDEPAVRLLGMPGDAEETIVAALLHTHGHADAEACAAAARALGSDGRLAVVKAALESMGPHDAAMREFEHVFLRYEAIVSAACFGQIKRHRMSTITSQEYDPALGITTPPSFEATGLTSGLQELKEGAENLYARLHGSASSAAAPYALLNAHRRRVLWGMNVRELYHVARLRCDAHAQWDIRRVAEEMVGLARERCPGLLLLACGKDRFDETRRGLYA